MRPGGNICKLRDIQVKCQEIKVLCPHQNNNGSFLDTRNLNNLKTVLLKPVHRNPSEDLLNTFPGLPSGTLRQFEAQSVNR